MIDTYAQDIAAAASAASHRPNAAQLAKAQREMWARHRYNAWRIAPLAALTASHVQRGPNAPARRVERTL